MTRFGTLYDAHFRSTGRTASPGSDFESRPIRGTQALFRIVMGSANLSQTGPWDAGGQASLREHFGFLFKCSKWAGVPRPLRWGFTGFRHSGQRSPIPRLEVPNFIAETTLLRAFARSMPIRHSVFVAMCRILPVGRAIQSQEEHFRGTYCINRRRDRLSSA